jgi:hypothetical protein
VAEALGDDVDGHARGNWQGAGVPEIMKPYLGRCGFAGLLAEPRLVPPELAGDMLAVAPFLLASDAMALRSTAL